MKRYFYSSDGRRLRLRSHPLTPVIRSLRQQPAEWEADEVNGSEGESPLVLTETGQQIQFEGNVREVTLTGYQGESSRRVEKLAVPGELHWDRWQDCDYLDICVTSGSNEEEFIHRVVRPEAALADAFAIEEYSDSSAKVISRNGMSGILRVVERVQEDFWTAHKEGMDFGKEGLIVDYPRQPGGFVVLVPHRSGYRIACCRLFEQYQLKREPNEKEWPFLQRLFIQTDPEPALAKWPAKLQQILRALEAEFLQENAGAGLTLPVDSAAGVRVQARYLTLRQLGLAPDHTGDWLADYAADKGIIDVVARKRETLARALERLRSPADMIYSIQHGDRPQLLEAVEWMGNYQGTLEHCLVYLPQKTRLGEIRGFFQDFQDGYGELQAAIVVMARIPGEGATAVAALASAWAALEIVLQKNYKASIATLRLSDLDLSVVIHILANLEKWTGIPALVPNAPIIDFGARIALLQAKLVAHKRDTAPDLLNEVETRHPLPLRQELQQKIDSMKGELKIAEEQLRRMSALQQAQEVSFAVTEAQNPKVLESIALQQDEHKLRNAVLDWLAYHGRKRHAKPVSNESSIAEVLRAALALVESKPPEAPKSPAPAASPQGLTRTKQFQQDLGKPEILGRLWLLPQDDFVLAVYSLERDLHMIGDAQTHEAVQWDRRRANVIGKMMTRFSSIVNMENSLQHDLEKRISLFVTRVPAHYGWTEEFVKANLQAIWVSAGYTKVGPYGTSIVSRPLPGVVSYDVRTALEKTELAPQPSQSFGASA